MVAADEAWCLLPALMPSSADALPQIIEVIRAAREQLRPGERLIMPQPPAMTALLNRDETEQILGLIGPVQTIREVETTQGTWRVAAAEAKAETFAFVLRWSIGPLEEFHLRTAPLFKKALARFKLLDSFHGIELPGPNIEFHYWAQLVHSFCRVLADVPDAESASSCHRISSDDPTCWIGRLDRCDRYCKNQQWDGSLISVGLGIAVACAKRSHSSHSPAVTPSRSIFLPSTGGRMRVGSRLTMTCPHTILWPSI